MQTVLRGREGLHARQTIRRSRVTIFRVTASSWTTSRVVSRDKYVLSHCLATGVTWFCPGKLIPGGDLPQWCSDLIRHRDYLPHSDNGYGLAAGVHFRRDLWVSAEIAGMLNQFHNSSTMFQFSDVLPCFGEWIVFLMVNFWILLSVWWIDFLFFSPIFKIPFVTSFLYLFVVSLSLPSVSFFCFLIFCSRV